jgi:hypothetical protein
MYKLERHTHSQEYIFSGNLGVARSAMGQENIAID